MWSMPMLWRMGIRGKLCLRKAFGQAKAACVWLSGLAGAVLARCHAAPVHCLECNVSPLLTARASHVQAALIHAVAGRVLSVAGRRSPV